MRRDLSTHIGVFAEPETREVRLWTSKRRTLLTPREAHGLAFSLIAAADRAEKRNVPGPKLEEERE